MFLLEGKSKLFHYVYNRTGTRKHSLVYQLRARTTVLSPRFLGLVRLSGGVKKDYQKY
jgi:hypothetical protein